MIYAICGLIGAGKTTYARDHFLYVTDLDYIESGLKSDQIKLTRRLSKGNGDVAHITCYPIPKERSFLDGNNAHYIWINTSPDQALKNIMKRARPRDLSNLDRVIQKNEQLLQQFRDSRIDFEIVNVF